MARTLTEDRPRCSHTGRDYTFEEEQFDNTIGDSLVANPKWDDLSASLIASRLDTASGRLDYDYFNAGVNFNSNARYPEEPVIIPVQCKHGMVIGADVDGNPATFRPHFHWLQQQAARPNMLLGYKKTNYGTETTFETDFTNYTLLTPVADAFTYVSGTLAQITSFPVIDVSDLTISASMDFVLFRDTANASGLFAGADPVATDVTVKYSDSHVRFDERGSEQEFVK